MRVSLSRPDRRLALTAVAAAVVYLACFELLHHSLYARDVITDVPVYQQDAYAVRSGAVPYRDFALEYPPGALAAFLVPTYVTSNYPDGVWWLMGALGVCCIALVATMRPPPYALPVLAVSPLLIGSYLPTRFDLWPTVLLVAALAAFVRDHHQVGWAALAAAFSAKLFPFVVMPIAAVWTLRRRGRGELGRGLWAGALVVTAAFLPFLVLAPRGLYDSLWGELSRPLQVESLAASFLRTFGHPVVIVSHRSLNLEGEGALGAASSIVSWVAIVVCWVAFARGPAERARFLRLVTASVCAFIAFGKVLSPQYMIWLVPLVVVVGGRRGVAATGILVAALVDTLIWFPFHYFPYVYDGRFGGLVVARDLLLVALYLVLILPGRAPRHSSSPARLARTRRAHPRSAPLPQRPRVGPGTP